MGQYSHKDRTRQAMRAATIAVRLGRYSPFALTGFAAILLLSSLINPSIWTGPRMAMIDALTPVIDLVGAPFRSMTAAMSDASGLTKIRAENARLKAENKQLHEWYQTAMLLRSENQSLKDLLNVIPEPDQSYITTRVIADSGSSFVKTVLIEAGFDNAVEEGQAVLGSQGMIGRVVEVGKRASRVLLLNDINSHVPVVIEGANQRAVLSGTNDDLLVLIHLPPDLLIEKGARIITSGTGGMFPTGLPIGEVSEIKNGIPMVMMYSDPYGAGYVQIVEKPQDPNVRQSIKVLTSGPE
ncbi:MAG: rod shape-determining protein MreC [Alphaproteobacteria bacterium]|nr:rod shape-determining protein MreC [Alphaproteobacteria bacterium]